MTKWEKICNLSHKGLLDWIYDKLKNREEKDNSRNQLKVPTINVRELNANDLYQQKELGLGS